MAGEKYADKNVVNVVEIKEQNLRRVVFCDGLQEVSLGEEVEGDGGGIGCKIQKVNP